MLDQSVSVVDSRPARVRLKSFSGSLENLRNLDRGRIGASVLVPYILIYLPYIPGVNPIRVSA